MRAAVVELRGVSSASPRAPLEGLDFSLGEGDAVVVLGHPGAGKTSLVRLLAGLDDVAAGSFELFGVEVRGLRYGPLRALRDRVAAVFEHGGVWSARTVLENLVLPMAYRTNRPVSELARDARLTALVSALALGGVGDRPTSSLDESERRRVLFVRALYMNPELLLVDEPRTALTRGHRRLVADLLAEERRTRAMSILYTSGDARFEPFECDRPVVLDGRRIVPGAVRLPERMVRGAQAEPSS